MECAVGRGLAPAVTNNLRRKCGGSKPPPYNKGVWALPEARVACNAVIQRRNWRQNEMEGIMKIKGYSFKCENPFFVYLKKHYCPYCGEKLIRKKVSQIIHSDSEEAKNYDFEVADITVKGNMKFTHIEFYCSVCQKQYTVKETKENDFLIDRWK